jgi:hypothetical protein
MVGSDDFMGHADFDLTNCEIHKSQEVTLHLEDGEDEDLMRYEGRIVLENLLKSLFRKNKKKKTLGYIIVRIVLSPLTKEEYNEVCDFSIS